MTACSPTRAVTPPPFEAALLKHAREIAILCQKVDILTSGSDYQLVD